jgi:phosphotransferase system enzyme I (PtsI)
MKKFTGIPASAGVAIGVAFVFRGDELPEIPRYSIKKTEVDAEQDRLNKALSETMQELKTLRERAKREISREQAEIFQAHLMMLEDVDFHERLVDRLKTTLCNIEWVVWDVSREFSQKLKLSPDPVFRERAVDIADVSRRLLHNLISVTSGRSSLAELDRDVILVARDLMPSDALTMNKNHVRGLALDEGSNTSHTAILARAFNIPAVLGLSVISKEIKDGEILTVNGTTGVVAVNPDKRTLTRQENEEKLRRRQSDRLAALRDLPAETTDGRRVALKANIGFSEEAEHALHFGAEGIGLYRSEFFFITPGKAADEEAQYETYSRVLKTMGTLPVTVRTVDLGGDKVIPEVQAGFEKNPLLGWRAIRLSLANPELFKVQLRAILRAGADGNVRIMFPMISGIEEMEQALVLLDEARAELKKKRQPHAKKVETGAMIEIPSAAITADILAEKSDFFSIGTNDLIQYSLAVDRGNEKVSRLSEPYHPAMLRLLKRIIDAAHEKGIKAAMCGELAGDSSATALLLGLGLDEFSMISSAIPQVKRIIRGISMESCQALAAECLRGRCVAEVRSSVEAWTAANIRMEKR